MRRLRVAVYCRVANYDELALSCQEQAMRKFASAKGYDVMEVVVETGSGTSMERAGIRRLYELAGAQAIGAVPASGTSRYARVGPLMGFIGKVGSGPAEVGK